MASITPTVLIKNKRKSGDWIVVYRLTHKRRSVYIKTSHVITEKNLNKDDTIKQKFVVQYLSQDINEYYSRISNLGIRVDYLTASELKEVITSHKKDICFIEFAEEYVNGLKSNLSPNSVATYRTMLNHLKDYQNGSKLNVMSITGKYVNGFLESLKHEKEITRKTGRGERRYKSRISSSNSLNIIYNRLMTVFYACKRKYNNEELGIITIPHNPFASVTPPKMTSTRKRSLTVIDIRKIRDYEPKLWTETVGRNIFLLSFYLCGMNLADIYANINNMAGDRISYNRAKVKNRRKDNGFISIMIPEEVRHIIEWLQENISKWANVHIMNYSANVGLSSISKNVGISEKATTYYARHSFATIARNDCRCRKEDVAMALNHIDKSHSVTDIYINPDWSIIDDVQKKVIDYINEDLKY